MSNLQLTFAYPWLLLLMIPALALATVPYFRLSRKYRRNRNRISSMILYICVMLLSISVLSGLVFAFERPNTDNEMFILVDHSYSNRVAHEKKEEFVYKILNREEATFKIGIITFANEAYIAAPLSRDVVAVRQGFENAPRPNYDVGASEEVDQANIVDDSATNIAAALSLAGSKFTNKKTAKIVLITDGIETDGQADAAIMGLISEGVRVDTVCINNMYSTEVQIQGIDVPNYNFSTGDQVKIGVRLHSNFSLAGSANLVLYDNNTEAAVKNFDIVEGDSIVYIDYTFTLPGAHQLRVELNEVTKDIMHQNNNYYAYLFISSNDRILLIDRNNESADLVKILDTNRAEENRFSKFVQMDIKDIPTTNTLSFLAAYDQIILMNIANSDLQQIEGLDVHLHAYVNELGGGLLTIGGSDPQFPSSVGSIVPHAYDKNDMNPGGKPSIYQSLLPVICEGYTPPLALMLVIDRSGSMAFSDLEGTQIMETAKKAAKEAIGVLSHRDYVGLVSFASHATTDSQLVPYPRKGLVERAIDRMIPVGGTYYTDALSKAVSAMNAVTNVENKHILMITDGVPEDDAEGEHGYNRVIESAVANGISVSMVSIMSDGFGNTDIGKQIAQKGNGKAIVCDDIALLADLLKEFLNSPEITQYNPQRFQPSILDQGRAVQGVSARDIPFLDGFYGARARDASTGTIVNLIGPFAVPIYAQWNVGRGKVGSFMCDLSGNWSSEFMDSPVGKLILDNIVKALLPKDAVVVQDIVPELSQDNYSLQIRVVTSLEQGEKVTVKIDDITAGRENPFSVTMDADASSGFPKCVFVYPQPGIYSITISKKNAAGVDVVPPYTTQTTFSYSEEYSIFVDSEQTQAFLSGLSVRSGGSTISIEDPAKVFEDIPPTYDDSFDPRITFIIMVIVLFILDMAVKKFKFKWPWEIVRSYRIKRELNKTNG